MLGQRLPQQEESFLEASLVKRTRQLQAASVAFAAARPSATPPPPVVMVERRDPGMEQRVSSVLVEGAP